MNWTLRAIAFDSPEYGETLRLRDDVLRKPIGLTSSEQDPQTEPYSHHLTLYEANTLSACLVLKPLDQIRVKMRQVAVAFERQGHGLGKALVLFSEEYAKDKGFKLMTLHARETAIPFYEKLGYRKIGDRFIEVGVPHFKMEKDLSN